MPDQPASPPPPQRPGSTRLRFLQSSPTLYPDGLHPGLVPGISVDEQRNKFGLNRWVFGFTAAVIVAFIAWGVSAPDSVSSVSSAGFEWAMTNAAWLFNMVMLAGVGVTLFLACSRYGRITLGKDGERPEFSRFSWIAMMFGAGIGVGIFFFGPSEPLSHYTSPPPHTVAARTPEAVHQAMAQSHFHWGLFAWGLYAVVGAALAYSSYRRGRVSLFSSAFRSIVGPRSAGRAGSLIDALAIIATVFGTAATLGLSAIQIGRGIEIIRGAGPLTNGAIIVLMAVLTCGFIISAVSGVSRGVRYLSALSITLTLGLVLFVFVTGPTLYLLNLLPSGLLTYADQLLAMAGKSLSWGTDTVDFQATWTAFYWAWWISWTPFVGMFLARISRGRTLREFALATMAVPSFILAVAFTFFGGTAITLSQGEHPAVSATATPEHVLFAMFDALPLHAITPVLLIFVLAVFFITSADSASVVMGTLSTRGNPAPPKTIVVFWGLCMMGIAVVMLLSGGENALSGLQSLTILSALPFSVVLLVLMVALVKDLRTDPAAIRREYARSAINKAVYRGIERHGDDFEISVRRAAEGEGAGAEFDSTAPRVTSWYERTDEDGNRVEYDYSTDTWADGWQPPAAGDDSPEDTGTGTGTDAPGSPSSPNAPEPPQPA